MTSKIQAVKTLIVRVTFFLMKKTLSLLTQISYLLNDKLAADSSMSVSKLSSVLSAPKKERSDKSILVTTFELRFFDNCLPLLKQIRALGITSPIMVFINGNLECMHNASLRSRFVQEISLLSDVSIICCNYMAGT